MHYFTLFSYFPQFVILENLTILDLALSISSYLYVYIWRYGLPGHKVLNAVVAELSIDKLKNQRQYIDSL